MDSELKKNLTLIRNKGALVSGVPTAETFSNVTDSLEMASDKLGGFSGDGGAIQDDSVKASLDLAHTDLDAIIVDITSAVDQPPTANSLHDILHKDGNYTFDNTTDSLEAVSDKAGTNGDSAGTSTLFALAQKRLTGRTQILEVSVTSAANAGDVILATVTTQPCLIKSIILHSDTASQVDLTSAAISGGASKVVSFLDAIAAAKANIDAIDEQVSWTGAVRLAATKTIVISLVGTGATVVDLTVTIEFVACADGGYLA